MPGIYSRLSASAKIVQSVFSVIYEEMPLRSILWSSIKINFFIALV